MTLLLRTLNNSDGKREVEGECIISQHNCHKFSQSDSQWRFEAVIRTTTTFAVRSVQDLLFRRTDFYVFWNFLKRKFSLKRQFWRQRLSFKKGECKNRRFLWNRWNRFAIFRDVENDVSDDDDVSVAQRDVTQCPCSRRCEKIQKLSRFWLDCAVVTFD